MHTPQGPFIASGTCFYWLHTHAADGIIHVESPVHRVFTLGKPTQQTKIPTITKGSLSGTSR